MNIIDLETRINELEAFVGDVMRVNTFTSYGFGKCEDSQLRTPLGNRAARLLGMPELPVNGGLDASLDLKS